MREYRKLVNKAILDSEKERDKILHVGFSVKKNRLPEYVIYYIELLNKIIYSRKHWKQLKENHFLLKKNNFTNTLNQSNLI